MPLAAALRRLKNKLRWHLGLRIAAPELENGTDESVARFYRSRITHCGFVSDPDHYEYPRARWILDRVSRGRLLEIGCGNGGMTMLLSPRVDQLVALDVSSPSLEELRRLALPNVEVVDAMVERYEPPVGFDWVVMSEVLEHLREPEAIVRRCLGWLAPGGKLLVTTPNGHWESNEHLQEFTLESFISLFTRLGFETIFVSYLRDRDERRRWLVAEAAAPRKPPAPEEYNSWSYTRRKRSGR